VRDGSACGRTAPLPMVDRCAAGRCAMDRHAAGPQRCRWSTAAQRGGARWIGMRPDRTAADGRPLRSGAVRDGSACGRTAHLPIVDRLCLMDLLCFCFSQVTSCITPACNFETTKSCSINRNDTIRQKTTIALWPGVGQGGGC